MPSRGVNPCGNAAGPPPMPLASAYNPTEVIKLWPTSGPIIKSISQKDREAISSRHSFISSWTKLRERKKDLLDTTVRKIGAGAQLVNGSFAHHSAATQQHQMITDAPGINQLMDRKHLRAMRRRQSLAL